MNFRILILVAMVFAVAAYAADPITADSPYQVTYMSNLSFGDSVVNLTNTGASSLTGLGYGTLATVPGTLCANVYVFSPDEEIVSCCTCPVTPDGLVSLDAKNDLTFNPMFNRPIPTSIVIKLVATTPVGGTCAGAGSNILSTTNTTGVPTTTGLLAWGTKVHANYAPVAGYAVTETAFTPATLSNAEINRLNYTCGITQQSTGAGICHSCGAGGLGAVKQ